MADNIDYEELYKRYKDLENTKPQGMADSLASRSSDVDLTPPMGMAESLPARSVLPEENNEEEELPIIPKQITSLLARSSQSTPPQTVKPAIKEEVSTEREPNINDILKRAQEDTLANQRGALLLKAGSQLGNAIGRTDVKSGENMAEELLKTAKSPLEAVKAQQEIKAQYLKNTEAEAKNASLKDQMNPNSAMSKYAQHLMVRLGVPTEGFDVNNIPFYKADQLIKLHLGIKKEEDYSKIRREQLEAVRTQKEAMQQAKKDSDEQKRIGKFADDMAKPMSARSGALGSAANTIRRAQSLNALIQGNQLTDIQEKELAAGFDALMRGGSTAVGTIKGLIPHDVAGTGRKMVDWITSNPNSVNRAKLLKLYKGMIDREVTSAQDYIDDYRARHAYAKYGDLIKTGALDDQLDVYNIRERVAGLKAPKKPSEAALTPQQAEKIQVFMDKNKIKDPKKAEKILREHGKL